MSWRPDAFRVPAARLKGDTHRAGFGRPPSRPKPVTSGGLGLLRSEGDHDGYAQSSTSKPTCSSTTPSTASTALIKALPRLYATWLDINTTPQRTDTASHCGSAPGTRGNTSAWISARSPHPSAGRRAGDVPLEAAADSNDDL